MNTREMAEAMRLSDNSALQRAAVVYLTLSDATDVVSSDEVGSLLLGAGMVIRALFSGEDA